MDVLPSIGWYEDCNRFKKSPEFNQKKPDFLGMKWKMLDQNLNHIFTHFKLNCSVAIATINDENALVNNLSKSSYRFVQKKNINNLALPSLIKKILNALKNSKTLNF
jgi:adenine-specific DNA glycosylase